MNITDQHINKITIESLREFRNEAFAMFASASGPNGYIQLGIDGHGNYQVRKDRKEAYTSINARKVIEEYKALLTNQNHVPNQ